MPPSAEGATHKSSRRILRFVAAVGLIVVRTLHFRFKSDGSAGFLELLTLATGAMMLVAEIAASLKEPNV